jgi:GTP cyclohydrolase IA
LAVCPGRRKQIEVQVLVDNDAVVESVRKLLVAIGEDPDREGLADTPRRIAEMYREVFAGLDQDPTKVLSVGFEEGHEEMVVVRDIPFYSMCEHHFLPFHGVAHVGYIPKGRVVGISKLARAVDIFAKRPQVQERLTSQIADALMEVLRPRGAAVVVEAEHLCMTMRGVKKPGSKVVTSAMRGIFRTKAATRNEFMSILSGHKR